tara:strand:+ start:570 stop:851 length:282 start_codon:yes stop_codon:yes gene_type:complete
MNETLKNKYFYISIFLILTLVFLLQNNRPVNIDFFFWNIASANLLVLLSLFFIFGALVGFGFAKFKRPKRGRPSPIKKNSSYRKPEESYRPIH